MEVTTLQLWPRQAAAILAEKNLSGDKLKEQFSKIIFPWQGHYDQQRQLYSSQIQEKPLFIVKLASEDEIITLYQLMLEYKLTVRIVGGRHSTALQNPDVFADMSGFTGIALDKDLVVGGGVTQGQVNSYLFNISDEYHFLGAKPNHPNSLAFPGGSAASVGCPGISTCGGVGTLRRTLGPTIDSIKSFRIVIPPQPEKPARAVTSSAEKYRNLFWALKGGGGANFGFITEITYEHPPRVGACIFYEIDWGYSEASRVIRQWQLESVHRNKYFNEDLGVFTVNDGSTVMQGINLMGIYVVPPGQSVQEAKRIVEAEARSLGGTLVMEEISSYSGVYQKLVNARVYRNFSTGGAIFKNQPASAEKILELMEDAKDVVGRSFIGIQLLGGEIDATSANSAAYYPRDARYFVDIFSFWDSASYQSENEQWNASVFDELFIEDVDHYYLGFPRQDVPLETYYGTNTARLKHIKGKIDPLNLLSFPGSL